MSEIILFILMVGIGSTIVLDIWGLITSKRKGEAPMDWGLPGRWVLGLLQGHFYLQDGQTPATTNEKMIGWIFHYGVGVLYAALLLCFGGPYAPMVFPAFLIGFVLATLAGMFIMMPAMGAGVMARNLPNRVEAINGMLISHLIFALAEYVLARLAS